MHHVCNDDVGDDDNDNNDNDNRRRQWRRRRINEDDENEKLIKQLFHNVHDEHCEIIGVNHG